jgi:WD40 repeat protein
MGEPAVLSQGSPVISLALLADGWLASGSLDGKINLWPRDGAGEPVVLSPGSQIWSLAVLPDGRLASGGPRGTSSPLALRSRFQQTAETDLDRLTSPDNRAPTGSERPPL